MKKTLSILAGLAALAPAAFAQTSGTDLTPQGITGMYNDAIATLNANVGLIAGVLAAAFGVFIAFVVYRLIKKASSRAG